MFEHIGGDWAYAEPNFFDELSKKFFILQNLHLVLLDGFLDGFWKFRLFIVKICILIWYFWVFFENYSMRMLSIRGNDFIACWAYSEPISSHTEHTRNEFPRRLSQQKNVNSFYMYNPCSAYAERILLHTEHTWNEFHRMLSIRGTDFIACWACVEMFKSRIFRPKNLVLQALGTIWFRFLQKNQKKISCLCTFNQSIDLYRCLD